MKSMNAPHTHMPKTLKFEIKQVDNGQITTVKTMKLMLQALAFCQSK